jgi:hypothetical protein
VFTLLSCTAVVNKILYVTKYKSPVIILEQDVRGDIGLVVTVETGMKETVCPSANCHGHFRLVPMIYSTIVSSEIKISFSRNPVQI